MSAQYKSALIRGLILGLLSGASTALATWATTGDLKTIIIAAGTAFLAPLLARVGVEGTFDTARASKGDVRPADVQPLPTSPQVAVPAGAPSR